LTADIVVILTCLFSMWYFDYDFKRPFVQCFVWWMISYPCLALFVLLGSVT